MTASSDATPAVAVVADLEAVTRRWWVFLTVGILFVIGGVLAIAWPASATVTISLFTGWLLIASGIVQGIAALVDRHERGMWWRAVWAVLSLIAGLYLVGRPLNGTITLTVVLAVYFIVAGTMQVVGGFVRDTGSSRWLMIVGGALGVLVGVMIATNLPSSADWAIGLLTGIWLLWEGMRSLALAFVVRRAAQQAG